MSESVPMVVRWKEERWKGWMVVEDYMFLVGRVRWWTGDREEICVVLVEGAMPCLKVLALHEPCFLDGGFVSTGKGGT